MGKTSPLEGTQLEDQELAALLERIRDQIDASDFQLIKQMTRGMRLLLELIETKNMSIRRLRSMVFGRRSEKSRNIRSASKKDLKKKPPGQKAKGHGRNAARDYPGALKIPVSHQLRAGASCPECEKGKLYPQKEPGMFMQFLGQPFIRAAVFELEKLRCNGCGKVFTAKAPKEAGTQKYDPSVGSMISLLHYGSGIPFYRIEKLQKDFGVPLAASTQWEIGGKVADQVLPAFEHLLVQGAQGRLIHNDDTRMKVLSLQKDRDPNPITNEKPLSKGAGSKQRTGIFTTGIISQKDQHRIALFFTGPNHAGENLSGLLQKRIKELPPPIQMCDGLSRNHPKPFKTILSNCLTHGRRGFVEILENFPDECTYVIDQLGELYRYDALARKRNLTDNQRLLFHQEKSASIMEDLHTWMKTQLDEKKVEPNCGLGKAITYMLKRWKPLTLFLRKAGVPLDNNICERALKMAILHRKNSLFYKTENGARVGDMFMSLIHTCRLCGANPFDYITQLQKNAQALMDHPDLWMPWNYRQTLETLDST